MCPKPHLSGNATIHPSEINYARRGFLAKGYWITNAIKEYLESNRQKSIGGNIDSQSRCGWRTQRLPNRHSLDQARGRGSPEPTSTNSSSSVWADRIGTTATAAVRLSEYR